MHIQMTETRRSIPDGFTVVQYHNGCIYEVPHTMGTQFVRNGWATEVEGEIAPKPTFSGVLDTLAKANIDFDRIFRPQPTRGSAPTNPATLAAKGEAL